MKKKAEGITITTAITAITTPIIVGDQKSSLVLGVWLGFTVGKDQLGVVVGLEFVGPEVGVDVD
jgi:hypothetical protein